ncbi:carboxypeptidase-like regulatory domain-containing protein [Catellatospora sichuanensis]|uniref:carboxypeptidase-like regulatory domain-containing protein n=1 Tax=Catellatospora sichuanensis TaxID=1969805 RepID=UPI0011835F3E|nr:carboxypeptidase-like regulatory domain-containing protein [Catellatospora sichuanensis]
MFKSSMRRAGVLALAISMATLGLALPAQAAANGSITGRLTDGGQPVVGASVSASSVNGDGSGWASTDGDGRYEMTDLPAGDYTVQFDASGHPSQYAYQAIEWNEAARIAVPAGGQVTVDDELLPTGIITGTFRDRAGNGLSVGVRAESDTGGAWGYTESDGTYTMHVLPGEYRVGFETAPGAYQYAVGTANVAEATRYQVAVGQTVTVDDTLMATGSVAGRFTDRAGAGIADLSVSVSMQNGPYYQTTTDADGAYRIDGVLVGSGYRVGFYDGERHIDQYATGQFEYETANLFTVTDGATTTVDDVLLPTGSVRFTVTNALTGAPLPSFHARAGQIEVSGVNGTGTAEGVTVGNQWVYVYANGYLSSEQFRVTVTEGGTAEVAVALTPVAKLTATVVDAGTGAPVSGICVQAMVPTSPTFGEGCNRSGPDGKVILNGLKGGGYQLFAFGNPYGDTPSPYGAQWVTADGGTGNQSLAAVITAVPGQTVTAPTIKLDRRGAITGTIRAADGTPAKHAGVSFGNFGYRIGSGVLEFPAAANGTYTVDWLGPYQWPLRFYADDHATQWSGNSGGRPGATRVKVRPGKTVTYDIQLQKGTPVTVNAPASGWYVAYNATTGDEAGACDGGVGSTCQMLVLDQKVRFRVFDSYNGEYWYGGSDFASATTVRIPATDTKTVTITR